jgi:hypothetical protein
MTCTAFCRSETSSWRIWTSTHGAEKMRRGEERRGEERRGEEM